MTRHIALVVAPRRQRAGTWQASESYAISPLFRRAREYCARSHDEWYLLSAEHGLLAPRQVVGHSERAWGSLSPGERAQWARRTAEALRARCERSGDAIVFVLYGPRQYARLLLRVDPSLAIELPLAGMTARERARWFDQRLSVVPRRLLADRPLPCPPPSPAPPRAAVPSRSFWRLRKPNLSGALSLVGARSR